MPKNKKQAAPKQRFIQIKGARVHNLKNIDVSIPRNLFTVITGLSGSGKSSLAFDTLYAEGQRRYVESLSAYARQFLGKLDKPDVEQIQGISPAVAIEQKVVSRNSRSTVGTSTEVYDYLKLLFARIGKTISPISGNEVKRDTIADVVDHVNAYDKGTKIIIHCQLPLNADRDPKEQLKILLQQGFTRILEGENIRTIEEVLGEGNEPKNSISLVIDRIVVDVEDEDNNGRLADSIETAFYEGNGSCSASAIVEDTWKTHSFSNRFELDGMKFEIPDVHFFSFNNPIGACKACEGFGQVIGIDEDAVIPDKRLSVYDDAIVCWRGEKMSAWKEKLIKNSHHFNFPIHRAYYDLLEEEKELLWKGNAYFKGIDAFFAYLEKKAYKIQYRVMLSRYRGKTLCPECKGTRLRKDAGYVKIAGKSIVDLLFMSITSCRAYFDKLSLSPYEEKVASRLVTEIKNRLKYIDDVGLGYLTLNRNSSTLSGGESQRINLAKSLGSDLVGSMYIMDEPSIGLHPRDTEKLIQVILSLRDNGNTVIVVEHDEEMMKAANHLIDMGPGAGANGGNIVFEGDHSELIDSEKSLTAKYLTGKQLIPVPEKRRTSRQSIVIKGARANNLKNIDVKIPLSALTVVTGVSGSGKSSLVKGILHPALNKLLHNSNEKPGTFDELEGDINAIKSIEFVDQNPIGKSSRSNPVTYIKAYDEIRTLFSEQALSKARGYKPAFFSFNVDGGRCEVCEGEGEVKIEMQFMADIHLTCENCKGKRFKDEILEVAFLDKNIHDVLKMTVDEAIAFFGKNSDQTLEQRIVKKIKPLQDVGLGYMQLGQSSNTLSGGEAQRIKLASFMLKGANENHTLFLFDEPTTGLHFHDIQKLLKSFSRLLDYGHTILVIEHNTEVIKCADWVIDLGPEGGDSGGQLVFEGTPEDLVNCKSSYTAKYLQEKLLNKLQVK